MDYKTRAMEIWRSSLNPLDKTTAELIELALRHSAADAYRDAADIAIDLARSHCFKGCDGGSIIEAALRKEAKEIRPQSHSRLKGEIT